MIYPVWFILLWNSEDRHIFDSFISYEATGSKITFQETLKADAYHMNQFELFNIHS